MKKQKSGFTLVELVVVVMILGILAAVAAPRLLETSHTATENGVKQTLAVVRDAIERYAAQNVGELPGNVGDADDSVFKADLQGYLRGPIPKCPFVDPPSAEVKIVSGPPTIGGPEGWVYSADTGEFIINSIGEDSKGTAYNLY